MFIREDLDRISTCDHHILVSFITQSSEQSPSTQDCLSNLTRTAQNSLTSMKIQLKLWKTSKSQENMFAGDQKAIKQTCGVPGRAWSKDETSHPVPIFLSHKYMD